MGGIISLLLIFILAIFIFPLLGVLHIIYRFLFGGRTTVTPHQDKRKKIRDKNKTTGILTRRNEKKYSIRPKGNISNLKKSKKPNPKKNNYFTDNILSTINVL